MPTDITPGWTEHIRGKYPEKIIEPVGKPMPGVKYLSDLLKPIDSKRQLGYNEYDLPPPFECPKSFVEVPHELLGTDGFPRSEHWLNPMCHTFGSGKMAKEYKKAAKIAKQAVAKAEKEEEKVETEPLGQLGKGDIRDVEAKPDLGVQERLDNGNTGQRAPATLPSLYDLEVGREPSIVPVPGKVRRARKPRHVRRATQATEERRTDLSAVGETNKDGKSFKREFRRFDDPVLPIHDYERTMDIVSNLYYIYDRGHGQFVDRKSQKLICTYQFEDLETMKPEIRQEHQQDVETVMMATQLFQRMPTPLASDAKYSNSINLETTLTSTDKPNSVVEPSVDHVQTEDNQLYKSPFVERNMKVVEPLVNPVPNNKSPLKELATSEPISPISRTPTVYQVPSKLADLLSAYRTYSNDGEDSPLTSLPSSDTEDDKPMKGGVPIKSIEHELELILTNTRPLNDVLSSPLTSLENSDIDDSPPPIPQAVIEEPSKKTKRQVTTNGALIHGKMYCFGCRAGFKRDVLYSPYIPCDSASHSLYKVFISELPIYGEHAGARYETFADNAFSTARSQLDTLGVPSMTAISKEQPRGPKDFAGNFAFTFHNFFNNPHTDNDKGKVYCVWYPMDSVSRKIVTTAEGFWLEGGFFLFPEYRIAFNFGARYVVQISWSGKSTFHQTLPSLEKEIIGPNGTKTHYTRLGCSSQITSSIARAAANFGTRKQFNFRSNCERKIYDCNDILEGRGKVWKKE